MNLAQNPGGSSKYGCIDAEGTAHFSGEGLDGSPIAEAAPPALFAADGSEIEFVDISPEEEAWFFAQVKLVSSLAADEEPDEAPVAPAGAPIVFLDIDDVICTNRYFCGYDAHECVTAQRIDVDQVYQLLMHPPSVAVLRDMHTQMEGRLRYVISSTWREVFTRAQLRHVLRRSGLDFVADNMEDKVRWATPKPFKRFGPDRYREVSAWLGRHHAGEPYVVIDDLCSGPSLTDSPVYPKRVILCAEGVGLQPQHLHDLLSALRTQPPATERW